MDDDVLRVMFVDDTPALADGYAEMFGEYDTRVAYGGRAGLERLDDSFDFVFLDRRMPGMSGAEVLEEIREKGYDVCVVMLTGVEPAEDVVEMGFDAYLEKPVDATELRELVDELRPTALDAFADPRLRALGDPKLSRYCAALVEDQYSARQLVDMVEESLPTVYRRLNTLQQSGLIEAIDTIGPDGNHYQKFSIVPSRLTVDIGADVEISVEHPDPDEIEEPSDEAVDVTVDESAGTGSSSAESSEASDAGEPVEPAITEVGDADEAEGYAGADESPNDSDAQEA